MEDMKNSVPIKANSGILKPLVKNEKTDAAVERVRERNRRAAAAAAVFSGADRNRRIRKFARVEYRCNRGCLLGAVVRVGGEDYLLTYEHVDVARLVSDGDHFADWVTSELKKEEHAQRCGQVYRPDFSAIPLGLEQSFREQFELDGYVKVLPIDSVPLAALISTMGEHVSGASSARCTCFANNAPDAAIQFVSREYMNCRHAEHRPTNDEIGEDILRMRAARKKTIYVGTTA